MYLNIGVFHALFVSIPESVGLVIFGFGLIGVAVFGRWLLDRSETWNDRNTGKR